MIVLILLSGLLVTRQSFPLQDWIVEIPGQDWKTVEATPNRVTLMRPEGPKRVHMMAVWTVACPSATWTRTPAQHAAGYFEAERGLSRPNGGPWQYGPDATRQIGSVAYHTMSYRTAAVQGKNGPLAGDGLFLLYFPEDFDQRHRFLVFMWQEWHPAAESPSELEEFDALVRETRLRPAAPSPPAQPAVDSNLPPRVLLSGVPYISFAQAAALEYQDKEILNPSFAAALGMVLQYWGQDLKLLQDANAALPQGEGGWARVEQGKAESIHTLQSYVARGIPVLIVPAITPVAHPPSPVVAAMAAAKGFPTECSGPYSGLLGRMTPLHRFPDIEKTAGVTPWESLLHAGRVFIGYDDQRAVAILHDPTFGPALEVPYERFQKMWQGAGGWYSAAIPRDPVRPPQAPAAPYPAPSPDQKAALHYVEGYALSCLGEGPAALGQFRTGLALEGISKGYRHLFLLELGLHELAAGRDREAGRLLRQATELVPEHARAWSLLAKTRGSDSDAHRDLAKSSALCADPQAQQTVADTLARDFAVYSCKTSQLLFPGPRRKTPLPATPTLEAGRRAYEQLDYPSARLMFEPLAQQGNPQAQFWMGWLYAQGHGVKQDWREAAKWFRLAAEQGHADAQFQLGQLHGVGKGVRQDWQESYRWLTVAAQQGQRDAQLMLGIGYLFGETIRRDVVEAAVWLQLAASRGVSAARQFRDQAEKALSPGQRAEVHRRVEQWRPQPGLVQD